MDTVKYLSFSSKRRFGAEIEVSAHMPKETIRDHIAAIDKNHKIEISAHNEKDYGNNHWNVKRDGSCKDKLPQHCDNVKFFDHGWEVSTFVGSGVEDISLVHRVMARLRDNGIRVNDNCSVHVHAEVADFTKTQIGKLTALWLKVEPIILQMVPERRTTSKYCVPLRKHYRDYVGFNPDTVEIADKNAAVKFYSLIRPPEHTDLYRRVTMNICNVCSAFAIENGDYGDWNYYDGGVKYKKRRTVELRLPEGTTDPHHVANWIKMFVRFVHLAKIKQFPTNLAPMNLKETLYAFGLHGKENMPVILSHGLWNLKVWFLERLVEFSRDKALKKEAFELLNYICSPYQTYTENAEPKRRQAVIPKKLVAVKKPGAGGKYVVENAQNPLVQLANLAGVGGDYYDYGVWAD